MTLCAIQKAASIFLQSIGKPVQAMVLSLARDFVLLAPLCVILPAHFGVTGPLYAAPIADIICLVLTVIIMLYTFKGMEENRSLSGANVLSAQMD
jgi:Na+-driven multidrug efflux pump